MGMTAISRGACTVLICTAFSASALAKDLPSIDDLSFTTAVLSEGKISSPFGVRSDPVRDKPTWHGGIDIRAAWDAPVHAPADGEVIFAGLRKGYGRMVDLKVSGGWVVRMAHLSDIQVDTGDHVSAGDILGEVGSTGRRTGPHLHLETRFEDKQYDPQRLEGLDFFGSELPGD